MNEETFNAHMETQEAIWNILVEEKGYYEVNYSHEFLNDSFYPCLIMYSDRCNKFVENLNKFGYYGIVRSNPHKDYLKQVFILDNQRRIVDPSMVIPILKKFDNVRNREMIA